MRLSVKVVPKASRDSIAGWLTDTLKITVRAPAEGGKANAAVEEILARTLAVPKCARIIAGKTSSRKVVEISGLSESEIRRRLSTIAGER
jgi:uncharacterized protein (TIGR00251 family)